MERITIISLLALWCTPALSARNPMDQPVSIQLVDVPLLLALEGVAKEAGLRIDLSKARRHPKTEESVTHYFRKMAVDSAFYRLLKDTGLKAVLKGQTVHIVPGKAVAPAREGKVAERKIGELADKNYRKRMRAAEALGNYKSARSIRELLKMLRDEHKSVRYAAGTSLGKIAGRKQLLKTAKDRDPRMRAGALVALGQRGKEEDLPVLGRALKDSNHDVQSAAVYALGLGSRKSAIPHLMAHVARKKAAGRQEALKRAVSIISIRRVTVQPRWLKSIVTLLDSPDLKLQMQAVHALGSLRVPETVPHLVKAAESTITEIRGAAAYELQQGPHNPLVVPILIKLLDDSEPSVRRHALRGMGTYKVRAQFAKVQKIAKTSTDTFERSAAIAALGKIGDKTCIAFIVLETVRGNQPIRCAACMALGDLGHPAGVKPLIRRLETDRDRMVQKMAAEALGKLGGADALAALRNAQANRRVNAWTLRRAIQQIEQGAKPRQNP